MRVGSTRKCLRGQMMRARDLDQRRTAGTEQQSSGSARLHGNPAKIEDKALSCPLYSGTALSAYRSFCQAALIDAAVAPM